MQIKWQRWTRRTSLLVFLGIAVVGTVCYVLQGKQLVKLRGPGSILRIAFSPDGRFLASGGPNPQSPYLTPIDEGEIEICLWDHATGKQLFTRRSCDRDLVTIAVTFSPDGQIVALGTVNSVLLFEVPTGRQISRLEGSRDWSACAFSPDGKTLAVPSLSSGKYFVLVDPHSGKVVREFGAESLELRMKRIRVQGLHTGYIQSIEFSPDGKLVATGGSGGQVRLCDVESGTVKETLKSKYIQYRKGNSSGSYWEHQHKGGVSQVTFSPNGKILASSGGGDGMIRLWDVASGKKLLEVQAHETGARSVSFSPNGELLASGGSYSVGNPEPEGQFGFYGEHQFCGDVKLWDAATGKLLHSFGGHTREVMSVAFSPDGKLLASGSRDRTVRIWDLATYKQKTK